MAHCKHCFIVVLFLISHPLLSQYVVTGLASAPEPVSNNAVTGIEVLGHQFVYSFGGIDSTKSHDGIHNRSFKLNVSSNTWYPLPDLPNSPTRIAAGASTVNNMIYIIGGYHVFANGNEQSSNLVHRFDPVADTFLANGASLPKSIDDHVQATYKDSLIFVVTGWSQTTNVPDVQIYNPELDTWLIGTSVPNNNLYKSFGASGTIIDDTIYYFGGARYAANFPIQNQLRKGYINPNNVTDITWSIDTIHQDLVGYRMACSTNDKVIMWIGGSNQTYNYDGIGYAGNVPVEPNNRLLTFHPGLNLWDTISFPELNMDFRGVASFDCEWILVGGMGVNQQVSNATVKLNCKNTFTNDITAPHNNFVYPNPTHNYIQVSNTLRPGRLSIFNTSGTKVLEQNISPKQMVNVSKLDPGVYIISYSEDGKKTIRNVLVKQ